MVNRLLMSEGRDGRAGSSKPKFNDKGCWLLAVDNGLLGRGEGESAGFGHEPFSLKFKTALEVQLCPMAVPAAWRKTLCESTIGQLFNGGVNPTETESFLDNIDVR